MKFYCLLHVSWGTLSPPPSNFPAVSWAWATNVPPSLQLCCLSVSTRWLGGFRQFRGGAVQVFEDRCGFIKICNQVYGFRSATRELKQTVNGFSAYLISKKQFFLCIDRNEEYKYSSLWSVQNLRIARKIGNIVNHNNYWSFGSDTHQSCTSKKALISIELKDGEKNRKHSETK